MSCSHPSALSSFCHVTSGGAWHEPQVGAAQTKSTHESRSLSRVLEPMSVFRQPAPLQGSSLRGWQCVQSSTAWCHGRAGLRVSYLSPHGSLVISPSCPNPVPPTPPGPGSCFPVSFWAGRVRSCCSSPCCRLRLWEQFPECFPV